jgi:putative spermidine/putrescine transport system permease protein
VTFPPQGYTLRWFAHIFDQNNFVSGFVTSLQVGIAAMIGGLLLGVPASLVLARRKFRARSPQHFALLPLVVPGIVAGTAIYVFQIEIELATELPLLGSRAGLVFAHIMITIPWTVRLLTASLSGSTSRSRRRRSTWAQRRACLSQGHAACHQAGVVAAALFGLHHLVRQSGDDAVPGRAGADDAAIAILQYLQWRIDPTIAAVSLLQIVLIGAGMLITDRYVKLTRVL